MITRNEAADDLFGFSQRPRERRNIIPIVFAASRLVLAGIGVGICSSVIPYVCDQLAMSRLPRASFALLLALLPATATIIGVIILRQIPGIIDLAGVALVMLGIAIHRPNLAKT